VVERKGEKETIVNYYMDWSRNKKKHFVWLSLLCIGNEKYDTLTAFEFNRNGQKPYARVSFVPVLET
jgi:hypothetical protein